MITPLAPLERFRSFDRFNKMMDELLGAWSGIWTPVVDVKETDQELTFICELPGMNEKDVDVEVRENRLTISGKRELRVEEQKDDYVRIERNYGTFHRSFSLDSLVKPDQVKAKFKDGLLTVTIPKTDAPKPKKIPVLHG